MCSVAFGEADLAVKAARGQTAMTFALTNGCNAIVDILDKHQAILDAEEALFQWGPRHGHPWPPDP